MAEPRALPAGVQVFERGWLSANNILLADAQSATLVDTGYVKHAEQTLALVGQALAGRPLDRLVNTHLHSDHCGGNAALQAHYPAAQTLIPPGEAEAVKAWDAQRLSYHPTGQNCPPFRCDGLLQPGQTHRWADLEWEVHAAPGHDPHSVILFAPEARVLISADALWEKGFGVVFPELVEQAGFEDVARTLDLIESLQPHTIIPGHGAVFHALAPALSEARRRLEGFARHPERHSRYGAKVLMVFKMLELEQIERADFARWARQVPYLLAMHRRHGLGLPLDDWLTLLLDELQQSGAVRSEGQRLHA